MRWHPQDRSKWQRWFAWYPVECRCGTTVWMETVWRCERHGGFGANGYKYTVFEDRPDICEDGHIPEDAP